MKNTIRIYCACALLCFFFTSVNLQAQTPTPSVSVNGFQVSSEFGRSVSSGDVNGDGYIDLIVGARNFDNGESNEGRVYIFHGSATGYSATPSTTIESNQVNAYFGYSVDCAGDVNNDGYDDLIVGAYAYDDGQTDEGKVFIYHGSSTGISVIPAMTIQNNQASSNLGFSVAGVGDVNNDGYDDVVAGAYMFNNIEADEGRAYLYLGSATGISGIAANMVESNDINGYLGYSVDGAGDINGDGYDDLIIGASHLHHNEYTEGGAYIYYGNATGINTITYLIIDSDQASAYFGTSVAGAGDINGDGYDDVVVGSPNFDNGSTNEGRVFIYYGSSAGLVDAPVTIESNQIYAGLGNAVGSAGDFNHDGYDDVIMATDLYDNGQTDEGKAFIYAGSPTGLILTPMLTLEMDQAYAGFGKSVTTAGDINGDGFDDILVGAYLYNGVLTDIGSVFIYYGNSCSSAVYYADYDNDGYGNMTDSATLCTIIPTVSINNDDCNDLDSLQNPETIWYVDEDKDGYCPGAGSPVNQCANPGAVYNFLISGSGDCNDLNYWANPSVAEIPDSLDNNCNGLLNEDLEYNYGGILQSNQVNANFGYSIANLGDVNLDGYDDLIVGSNLYDNGQTDEGRAFIYYGTSSGLNEPASLTLENNSTGSYFGYSVSSAGDVNGDGYMDAMIGAPYYDGIGTDLGRVYIYHGSAAGLSTSPNTTITGAAGSLKIGIRIMAAGDVNGDGFDDINITTMQHNFIYYGSATGIATASHSTIYHFGPVEATTLGVGAGDLNNDGFDDIIVGESGYTNGEMDEGGVGVYLGTAAGITTTPSIILQSNEMFAGFGYSVNKAGDINNDGFDDIVVGSHYGGVLYAGKVYVYFGSAAGISAVPQTIIENYQDFSHFGQTVAACGDINGDGFNDIIAGADLYDTNIEDNGRVTVYHGSATGVDTTYSSIFFCDKSNFQFSTAIASGDFNGDSNPDMIIGAYDYTAGETNEGIVYEYDGNDPCAGVMYYADADGDTYGDELDAGTYSCSPVAGHVTNNTDCNDLNAAVNSASTEICNAIDDNCNGLTDDGVIETISISAGGATIFCQGGSVLLTASYTGASVQWQKNGSSIPGAISSTYSVTKTGNYTAVTTSLCGTATSSAISVTVNKNPNASISAGGATTFCAGGSVTLTEVAVAGCTYQWYKGASLIAGATSTNYIATTAGNYKCRVTKTATGCYKNSNIISVTVPCREAELSVLIGEPDFTIYPNPNNGTFEITIPNLASASPFEGGQRGMSMEVYNSLGEITYARQINSSDINFTQTISLENISSGIYFVRIAYGNNYFEQKLIIE